MISKAVLFYLKAGVP